MTNKAGKLLIELRLLYMALIAFCAIPLYPESLEELVGTGRASAVRGSSAAITEVQLKEPQPVLLPAHEGIRRLVTEIQNNLQPSIMVETLFLYNKPGAIPNTAAGINAANASGWTESERTGLFNQILALSSLAGIQYFSASRNTIRTFYEISNVVDGPDTRRIIADPVYTTVPQTLTLYARQKDLTFGDNIYRYDYYSFPDALSFVQENLTAMFAGIVPAIGKNKLHSVMAVFDCGDSLLIYAVSMTKAVALPGMGDRIGASFSNRAEAVLKWFMERAGLVY